MNSSIHSFDYNISSKNLIFSSLSNDKIKAFIIEKFDINEVKFGSLTNRIVHLRSQQKKKSETAN